MVLTPDLAEAERFYGEALALAPIDKSSNQLVYDLVGTEFRVIRCDKAADARKHAASAATICIFEVDSIDAEMGRMRERGVVFIHETPAQSPDGGFRYAAFHAPGGNVHEIMERRAVRRAGGFVEAVGDLDRHRAPALNLRFRIRSWGALPQAWLYPSQQPLDVGAMAHDHVNAAGNHQ